MAPLRTLLGIVKQHKKAVLETFAFPFLLPGTSFRCSAIIDIMARLAFRGYSGRTGGAPGPKLAKYLSLTHICLTDDPSNARSQASCHHVADHVPLSHPLLSVMYFFIIIIFCTLPAQRPCSVGI